MELRKGKCTLLRNQSAIQEKKHNKSLLSLTESFPIFIGYVFHAISIKFKSWHLYMFSQLLIDFNQIWKDGS